MHKTNSEAKVRFETEEVVCKNCHISYKGNYCTYCGQSKLDYDKPFSFIISDLAGNLFAFDARIVRSVTTLLFRPGRYALDFIQGRRARYMPPFRLYVFVSFLCFLLFSTVAPSIEEELDNIIEYNKETGTLTFQKQHNREERKPEEVSTATFVKALTTQISQSKELEMESVDEKETVSDSKSESMEMESVDEKEPPVESDSESTINLKKISKEVEDASTFTLFGKEFRYDLLDIYTHQSLYIEQVLKYLSWSMFFLMPFFAFLLWLFFMKSREHYFSHFILSVNIHTFSMTLFGIAIALFHYLPTSPTRPFAFCLLIIPIHIILSFRKVYITRKRTILFKFLGINSIYWLVVLLINCGIIIIGFARN